MNVRTAGALTDLLLPLPKAISKVKIIFASLKMLEIAPASESENKMLGKLSSNKTELFLFGSAVGTSKPQTGSGWF